MRPHSRAGCYDIGRETVTTRASTRLKTNAKGAFNAQDFLDSAGVARKVVEFGKKATVFSQRDPGRNVLYIRKGAVRLSIVNETGKEAVVAVWDRAICLVRDASPASRFGSEPRPRLHQLWCS